MKYSLVLVVIVAFFSQIASGQGTTSAYDVPEAYAVYSALLEGATAKRLVIQVETEDYPIPGGRQSEKCLTPIKGDESVYTPIIADYRSINTKKWLLQKNLK